MSSTAEIAPVTGHGAKRRRENWALGLLTIGLITGPIGLFVGWYLAATSQLWSTGQKALAGFLPAPAIVAFLMFGGGIGGYSCTQAGSGPEVCDPHTSPVIAWSELMVVVAVLVGIVFYLHRAATRSAQSR